MVVIASNLPPRNGAKKAPPTFLFIITVTKLGKANPQSFFFLIFGICFNFIFKVSIKTPLIG